MMTDVLLLCVREDVERANALADMIEAVGFSVDNYGDDALDDCAVVLAFWSPAAGASDRFRDATLRASRAGKAMVASFFILPPPFAKGASVFSLRAWRGASDDAALEPLFLELDQRVRAARATQIARAEETPDDLPACFAWARLAKDMPNVRNGVAAAVLAVGIVVSAAGAGAASAAAKMTPVNVHSVPLSMVIADARALQDFVYAPEAADLEAQEFAALARRGREPASAPPFAGRRN